MRHVLIVVLSFAACAPPALAQHTGANTSAAQAVGAAQAHESSGESLLQSGAAWIENLFDTEKNTNGFYPEFGGLPSGSGISAGPGFRHGLFDGRASITASAAMAWSRSTFGQATFELPRLAGGRVNAGTQVKWQDFTRVTFFGVGPDSRAADQTAYALKNTDYTGFAAVRPQDWLTIGGRFGYSQRVTNRAPHRTTHFATHDRSPTRRRPPGRAVPHFCAATVVNVDTRDRASRPTRAAIIA